MAPIFIARAHPSRASDEAGILITKRVLPSYHPGPYAQDLLPDHMKPSDTLLYVPPLGYFCIKAIFQNVDSIDMGGVARLRYHSESHTALTKGLISFFDSDTRDIDMRYVDPRLWGTLIQLYSPLPACFNTYTLPLSDTHLTQLQCIRSTHDFTFITVLDLASCPELTDDTIGELKPLNNLCVLDLSSTPVGSWGVKKLSMCLVGRGVERRGPWGVRVWSLRGCKRVDDTVKDVLARFPLLCSVDLRDTSVTASSRISGFASRPPISNDVFYYPNPPLSWITGLLDSFPASRIFESESPAHILHINKLTHVGPKHPDGYHRTLADFFSSGVRHRNINGKQTADGIGEDGHVLALFPNGTQSSRTTHDISLVKKWWKRQEAEPRKAAREDVWPLSAGYGYEDDSDRLLFNCSGYDYSEDDNSENNYSDKSFPEEYESADQKSEQHSSQDEQCDNNSLDQAVPSIGRELFQTLSQNEAATQVNERDVAEREARRFYVGNSETEVTLRLRGRACGAHARGRASYRNQVSEQFQGRRELSSNSSDSTVAPQTRRLIRHPRGDDQARSLMFFREPPPFDSIVDGTSDKPTSKRRKKEEIISVKKTGIIRNPISLPKTLLDRLGTAFQDTSPGTTAEQRAGATTAASERAQSPNKFGRRRDLQIIKKDSTRISAPASMNPFLAKKKRRSRSRLPSLSAASMPTAPELTTFPTLIRPDAASQPRHSSVRSAAPKSDTTGEAQIFLDTEKTAWDGQKQQRAKPAFDMKAWAAKGKK